MAGHCTAARCEERGCVLRGGIDLGGTKILAVVVDANSEILGRARQPTPMARGPAVVAEHMAATLTKAAEDADASVSSLGSIGVGAPGYVDSTAGTVANASSFAGWSAPFPLARRIEEILGPAVVIGNDVDAAVVAEASLGAGRALRSFLGIWWGTGVGGGLVLDRQLWHGRGVAGEFGHMVIRRRGAPCPCGRRGCIEAYAGRLAMEQRARELAEQGVATELFSIMEKRGADRLTSGVWERALRRGDPLAVRLVDCAAEAIALGAASTMNLLDLDGFVVGGGLGARLGAPYAQRLADAVQPRLFNAERQPTVRVAELGDDAGAVGATLLAPPPAGARPSSQPVD